MRFSKQHVPRLNQSQSGQAMTEFVIGAMLVLLPLFLIIPVLGKYADVKATNAIAARYVAWERTVWYGGDASSGTPNKWPGAFKTDDAIRNEVNRRVVSARSDISAEDASKAEFATDDAKPMWTNRDGSAMLSKYDDATSALQNSNAPDAATKFVLQPITSITNILGFALESKGLFVAQTSLKVGTLAIGLTLDGTSSEQFDPGDLTFSDKNAVLANTWAANGAGHVKSMTGGLTPLGFMNNPGLKAAFTVMKAAMLPFTPEIIFLEPGKIEPDVVPPDRVTN